MPSRWCVPHVAFLLTALAGVMTASGCNTVSSVQGVAPDAGLHAQLAASLPELQTATLQALESTELGVQRTVWEGDSAWAVVASEGMTLWSYGEIVRIRAVRTDSATTDLWLVSQRRLETNVAAKDWTETLLAGIRDALRSTQSVAPDGWLALRAGAVHVLDAAIAPGDTTPFHTHDAAMIYVPIALSPTNAQVEGGSWGASGPENAAVLTVGVAATDYLYTNHPLTHRVANVGSGQFRIVEILNFGSGVPPGTGPSIPGEIQTSSSWFRQSTLVLGGGKHTKWDSAEMPVVLVVPGTGQVVVERAAPDIAYDAPPSVTVESGGWTFIPVGARYRLRNDGAAPSTVIVVQVRQKSSAASGSP